ncbi:MAG: DNA mismatch repair endonuclease MutL [Candidatus Cryptobacteroides sp.]
MGKIQKLTVQLANMIAAGEVVQRPASVVKELLENAVDAGATQINLIVKDSGRTLIQVIDNGSGMSPEDAKLCFERHATSKISEPQDLEKLSTFGFRGEALASIAAVSQVKLKSRRESDEVGTQVIIEGGELKSQSSVNQPKGTSIEVRNLFFNTPARRKFLKADSVEFKHIVEEFNRVAITKPELAFSLSHNDRDVLVLKKAQSVKFRILDLLGSNVVGDVVDLKVDTSIVKVSGYIGRPQSAKKALGNQYFFVNGRFFKSAYLHKAVMNAYAEVTPDGLTPSYFIFLSLDPQSVDVNISPTKTEVKFENDSLIFQTIFASVRETLGRNGFGEMIDFEASAAVDLPQLSRNFTDFKASEITAALEFESDYNPFASEHSSKPYSPAPQDYSVLFDANALPQPPSRSFVLAHKFICTPSDNGLLLTNIHRAQVRILYEQMLSAIKGGESVCQTALFPIQVQVGAAYIPLVEAHSELLGKLGFDITVFGSDTVVVAGVPQGYDFDEMSVKNTVANLLQILEEEHHSLPEIMQADAAKKLSELGVASASNIKSEAEARGLLDRLSACKNSELTPSGKRISKFISAEDLDKLF